MARYLWQSLVETIAPDMEQPAQESDKPLSGTVGNEPLDGEGERITNLGLASKAALEQSEATEDPIIAQPRDSRTSAVDGADSGEIVIIPPQDLSSQIAVQKTTTAPEHHQEDPEDMLHDVKLYQDAAIEYRNVYQALKKKILRAGVVHGRGLWSPNSCRSSSLPETTTINRAAEKA